MSCIPYHIPLCALKSSHLWTGSAVNDLAGSKNLLAPFQVFILAVVGAGFIANVFLMSSNLWSVQMKIPWVVLLLPLQYFADVQNLMRLKCVNETKSREPLVLELFFLFLDSEMNRILVRSSTLVPSVSSYQGTEFWEGQGKFLSWR